MERKEDDVPHPTRRPLNHAVSLNAVVCETAEGREVTLCDVIASNCGRNVIDDSDSLERILRGFSPLERLTFDMLSRGHSKADVARASCYDASWITQIIDRSKTRLKGRLLAACGVA